MLRRSEGQIIPTQIGFFGKPHGSDDDDNGVVQEVDSLQVIITVYIRMQSNTEFFHAAVTEDGRLCRVEPATSQEVADFESVDQTVATVPEVEQVEHFPYV